MRYWVRRWEITIRWDDARYSPYGTTRYQTHVDTSAQLRRLVEAARADPHVTAFPYKSIRALDGEAPTECRRGHSYSGGSATRPHGSWIACGCGGHALTACRWPGCGDVLVDPVPDDDCDPRVPRE
ncbi:MAG TPA: hypothetical protein VJT31_17480 [Rugosimonospora sp.]|nr:hypothetical protein [Rugosimonospora sp.]